jgi:hypothetical protein
LRSKNIHEDAKLFQEICYSAEGKQWNVDRPYAEPLTAHVWKLTKARYELPDFFPLQLLKILTTFQIVALETPPRFFGHAA